MRHEDHRDTYVRTGGSPHAARSTVYAHARALALTGELNRRGIVDDAGRRDVQTGRKVSTIIYQVAMLGPHGFDDWTDAALADLVDCYLRLRGDPLDEVRRICERIRRDPSA